MNKLLRILRLLGSRSRLRIITLLVSKTKPVSVSAIAQELKMTHSAISHQLGLLSAGNIIASRKRGREVFYSMADTTDATKVRLMINV